MPRPLRSVATLAALASLTVAATPVYAALAVGAAAPAVSTPAVIAGKPFEFHLADALKRGPVVLYFFPAAFTSGCTIEAHEFSDATAQFAAEGATVIGLAHDPIDKLSKFSVTECRNKFAVGVASDAIIAAYKVKLPIVSMSDRTSFVIAPDGRIIFAYSALSPSGHVGKSLAAVRDWRKAHPRS